MDHYGATTSLTDAPLEPGDKPGPPTQRLLLLVKFFDRKEHAEGMMDGTIRAGRLKCFRKTEDAARRDSLEGTILLEGGTLTLETDEGDSFTVKPEDLAAPIEMRLNWIGDLNVFCMTGFRPEGPDPWPSWPAVDQLMDQIAASLPSCRKFGGHAVVITDPSQFLARINRAAERENWRATRGLVSYYDSYPPEMEGTESVTPAFLKPRDFFMEREFRIAFNTGTTGDCPVTLDIGGIRDISFYIETEKLATMDVALRDDRTGEIVSRER